jgi:hypothetical protein
MRPEVPAGAPATPNKRGGAAAERQTLEFGGRQVVRALAALRTEKPIGAGGVGALVST